MATFDLKDPSGNKIGELHERGPGFGDVYGSSGFAPIGEYRVASGGSPDIPGVGLLVLFVLLGLLLPIYGYYRILKLPLKASFIVSVGLIGVGLLVGLIWGHNQSVMAFAVTLGIMGGLFCVGVNLIRGLIAMVRA